MNIDDFTANLGQIVYWAPIFMLVVFAITGVSLLLIWSLHTKVDALIIENQKVDFKLERIQETLKELKEMREKDGSNG